ncbi:MAG TPA: carbohydrate ABC transporter permease [Chloroflexota bacterium]|nr:carbohydrate ABC transporter permease [Chloroflexota bacterium]
MSTVAISGARRTSPDRQASRLLLYAVVIVGAIVFMLPFLFALTSSLKTPQEIRIFPPTVFPAVPQWKNYPTLFEMANLPYGIWYDNSLIITILATVGTVLSASASAYGFARFRWPGRDVFFTILLATLILPEQVVLIPRFLMFHLVPSALIGHTMIDTWWPLIIPSWFGGGAFSVFLLRQFFLQIPHEFEEAAVIDGASTVSIFWQIVLPLSKPALATVAIFAFLGHWNSFLEPLIFLTSTDKFPLSVGLRWLQQNPADPTIPQDHLLMAGSVLMVVPPVLIFFSMQRYFIRGVVMSGIKG